MSDHVAPPLKPEPLFNKEDIEKRVGELGVRISRAYHGREVVLIVILKGSVVFATDLMRRLVDVDVSVEFIQARSYAGTLSTGSVHLTLGPEKPVTGKHVIIIEDILDTGRTSAAILDNLLQERPESVAICALIDKPSRRTFDIRADYVGFTIGNEYVVGYGLDYNDRFRNLTAIYALDQGEA